MMRIFAAAYLALIGGVTSALFMRLKRAADRDELNTERVLLRYGFMYGGRSGNYAGPGYFLRRDARIPTNTASIPPSSVAGTKRSGWARSGGASCAS